MAERQPPQLSRRDARREFNERVYGTNIPNVKQKEAYAQSVASAEKKGAALQAGFTPPTAAATGDLLKRRLELFKSMQDVGREKAAELAEEAEGLQISKSGFRQALNRIPLTPATTATTPAATATTPAATATTPATTATTPAVTSTLTPPKTSSEQQADNVFGTQFAIPPTLAVDPKSREGQVAAMLRTIESESGKGESNADILRRLNEQRVAQGQAPLRIKLPTPTKTTSSVPSAQQLLLESQARVRSNAPMTVGGVVIPQYSAAPTPATTPTTSRLPVATTPVATTPVAAPAPTPKPAPASLVDTTNAMADVARARLNTPYTERYVEGFTSFDEMGRNVAKAGSAATDSTKNLLRYLQNLPNKTNAATDRLRSSFK